jgi:hypothetical protein
MKKIKIREVVSYNGHNVKSNGIVNLNLKAMYSELVNTIQVLQLLNNDVKISVVEGKSENSLGMFRVKNVSVSDDGESVLKFETLAEAAEMDKINSLVGKETEFIINMFAEVEVEDETDADEEVVEDDNDEEEVSDDEWDEIDEEDWGDDDE